MGAPRLGTWRVGPGPLIAAAVAVAVFWIAYDNGSYGLESRNVVAIAVWWGFVLAVVFRLGSRAPLTRATLVTGSLLAALAGWTLLSLAWSPDVEATFNEFNRVSLYLGLFAFVTVMAPRWAFGRWADGLAVAVSAVAVVALSSRLVPGVFPSRDLPTFLPGSVTRLSFPLGYWNGLAIFLALGIPMLLRVAVVARRPAIRGFALAPIPVITCAIYLASSRGGFAAALVGVVAFLALTERRWAAAGALVVSALGSAAAIAVLLGRDELVDGPLGTDLVERQGRTAAVLIALACLASGAVYAIGSRLLADRIRLAPAVGWVVVAVTAIAAVAIVVAADPVERFRVFKQAPGEGEAIERGDFVRQHLLSGAGSGRWQFWETAVDEWRDFPVVGDGAGSYEAYWAEHRTISLFVKDAHALYLETLGELGVVGFGLVLALVVFGLVTGARRARASTGDTRVTVAALGALFAGYAVAAGFDWVWELTAVSALAFAALALVSGSAAAAPEPLSVVGPETRVWAVRGRFGLGVAALVVVWALILAQAVPLLAQGEIADSQAAVESGDLQEAFSSAGAARDIQPWAATPYLQLALVSEEAGNLASARAWIDEAIERDERDWRLWLVSARVETKAGRIAAAERSLRRAAELNPRSPLFEGLFPDIVDD